MEIKTSEFFKNLKYLPAPGTDDFFQLIEWEKQKCLGGVTIQGVFIPGWLYWHLNHWWIGIDEEDEYGNETIVPKLPELRDNEWERAEAIEACKNSKKGYIEIGQRRGGKALLNSSPLYTPQGEIPIGQAKVGMEIYDPQGELTTIKEVYPQGLRPIYRVHLQDGRDIYADEDHLWSVQRDDNLSQVLTTGEILRSKHKFYLPLSQPINYPSRKFPLDPYEVGLTHNIPKEYLLGSIKQRIELLRGVLDTREDENILIPSEIDPKPILDLIRSLGGSVTLRDSTISMDLLPKYISQELNLVPSTKERKMPIEHITFQGWGEATCIVVDNEDKLFLTEGFTPTHNSEALTSFLAYNSILFENSQNAIITGNSNDQAVIIQKFDFGHKKLWDGLYIPKLDKDWRRSSVRLGYKDVSNEDHVHSLIAVRNANNGNNTEVAAGLTLKTFILDECGKWNFGEVLAAAKPALLSPKGWRGIVLLTGCVCAGTKVWTKKGELKNIEDLQVEDGILGYDGKSYYKEDIKHMKLPSKKPCLRITTTSGNYIECSTDHPFLSSTKKKYNIKGVSNNSISEFVKASNLKVGDKLYKIAGEDNSEKAQNYFYPSQDEDLSTSIEEGLIENTVFENISKIEDIGEQYVYNLQTIDTHTYIANGFITHNTGGSFTHGEDCERYFNNPESNKFMGFKDEETGKITGKFMSGLYRMDCKVDSTLADYLQDKRGVELDPKQYKKLSKIPMKVSDKELARRKIEEDRALKARDPNRVEYLKEIMYYPLTPDECFMTEGVNIFNEIAIKQQQEFLYASGKYLGDKCILSEELNGEIHCEIVRDDSIAPISTFPLNDNESKEGCIIIYEHPPKNPPYGLYVSAIDPLKHDKSSGDSLQSIYVFKRMNDVSSEEYQDMIVAQYTGRMDTLEQTCEICRLLIKYYNALTFVENEDIYFIKYMQAKMEDHYLVDEQPFIKNLHPSSNVERGKGFHATPKIVAYLNSCLKSYSEEVIAKDRNEEGEVIKKILGVSKILDPMLLEEMRKFRVDSGNYDRIRAASAAIALARHMDPFYKVSSPSGETTNKSKKKKRRRRDLLSRKLSGGSSLVRNTKPSLRN